MGNIRDFFIKDNVLTRYVGAGEENVVIPDGVTAIGNEAFKNKVFIKTVFIPNTVTHIGYDAFSGCRGLISVDIPNSVTSTYNEVFDGCSNLKSVSLSNALNYIGSKMFCDCASLESICIPNGVISIGEYAFARCKNLKKVIIPKSVTKIENGAFFGCESLKDVVVSHDIEYIGRSAFPRHLEMTNEKSFIVSDTAYTGMPQNVITFNSVSKKGIDTFEHCSQTSNEGNSKKLNGAILPQDISASVKESSFPDLNATVIIDQGLVPCEEQYTAIYIKSRKLVSIIQEDKAINTLFALINKNFDFGNGKSGILNDEIIIKLSDFYGIENVTVPKKGKNIIKSLIAFFKVIPVTLCDIEDENFNFEDLICKLKENEEIFTSNIERAEWFQYLEGGYGSGLEDSSSFARLLEKEYEERGAEHITVIREFEYNKAKAIEKYKQTIE